LTSSNQAAMLVQLLNELMAFPIEIMPCFLSLMLIINATELRFFADSSRTE
jgi:hypothetical protein